MKPLAVIVGFCILLALAVGVYVYDFNLSAARKNAEALRPYKAQVEVVVEARCGFRHSPCFWTTVRYTAAGSTRRALVAGSFALVGEEVTIWAKPPYTQAYISRDSSINLRPPDGIVAVVLCMPILASLAALLLRNKKP